MRRLRFYIIIFLTIIWFLVLLSYFIVQTSFGAKIISQQLSKLSSYTISIGSVNHSFSNFYELIFDDVVVNDNNQEIVNVPKLVVGFDKNDLWQLSHFKYVTVINGTINNTQSSNYAFSANTLRFVDSTINILANNGKDKFSFTKINGGLQPFSSSGADKYQFDFTSQETLLNQISIKSLLIQGFHRDGITTITNLGGNINDGFFVSKLKIQADDILNIEQLNLHNIHFQSTDDDFFDKYSHVLPKLTIKQLLIQESSIQLPSFLIEKGNIEATNLRYEGQWSFDQGSVIFTAEEIVWHDELFSSVLAQLSFQNQEATIQKVLAKWNKGSITFSGKWKDNTLHLDQLMLADIVYEIPENLGQSLLPNIFRNIKLDKLNIFQSLIIRKQSDFPFSLYNFQASGKDITLAKAQKLGLFSGTVFFKSEKASLNRIDIRYPDLVLKFDSDNYPSLTFSSLTNGGIIESRAKVDLSQNELLSLQFDAYGVTSLLLENWKLIKKPPNAMNYSANLHGKLQPFNLSGKFSANGNEYIINLAH